MGGPHENRSSRLFPGPLARGVLVVLLGVGVATCRIGDLLTAPSAGTMTADSVLAVSAFVGSRGIHTGKIHVDNTGRGTLTWTARVGSHSPWLSIENATGQSKVDSVRVRLDPAGLDTGLYRDSILLSSDVGGSAVVPVRWRIDSCSVTPILASGDQRTDTLTAFDCGAPHDSGMQAKLYSFNGTLGEIKTILLSARFNGHLIFDSLLTAAPIDSAADCLGDTKNPCLYYINLTRTAPYYIEVTTATRNDSGPFRLRLINGGRDPNAPDSLGQWLDSLTPLLPGATIHQDSLLFRAVVSDSDLVDSVSLEAEVQPIRQCFTGNPQFFGPLVKNGHAAWVPAGSPLLHDATSYHWQVRARDRTNRPGPWVRFGGDPCSASADFSIQVNHPPQPPTALAQYQSDGATLIPQGDTAFTPSVVLKATANDPDSGELVRLEVEVQPLDSSFTGRANGFGQLVAAGGTASAPVSSLPNGRYHWQARVVDNSGAANDSSGWVPYPGALPDTGTDFVVHLPPTHLAFGIQPGGDTAGRPILPSVVVTVQDQNNHIVTDFTGPVTTTIHDNPGGGTLSGTLTVNAASGSATFANLRIDKAAIGYTIQASIAGGTIVSPPSSSFNVVAGPAQQLVFTTPPAGDTAGRAIFPAIQVAAADSFGNPATFGGNVTLTLAANPGGARLFGDTSHNAAGGIATFANVILKTASPGYTLRAYSTSSPGLIPDTSGSFTVVPAPASQLGFGPQPGNTVAGAAINSPTGVGVAARDSLGNTATSFTGNVTMAIASGPGTFTPASTITVPAAAGFAPFTNLHIQKTGAYTLRATAGVLTSPASNPFSITVGTLARLGFVAQPTQTADSAAISPAVQVAGQDSVGNAVIGFSGTVTMSLWNSGANPGGGALSGTLQVAATPATGIATFSNLRINELGAGYSLLAGSFNLQSDTSASFSIVTGPAAKLAIAIPPSPGAQSGVAFAQQPVIRIEDAAGNPISQSGVLVTATVASGPAGASLSNATATTNAGGAASFSGLAINGLVGSYTLSFGASGLAAATSGPLVLSAGPASRLAFGQQPTATTGGGAITPAVTVRILDAAGNQTSVNNSVALTITAGTGTPGAHLSGGTSIPAVNGVATFGGLSIDSAGAGYTLQASSPGLTGVTSSAFDVAVGAAAQLVFRQQPTTTIAGAIMPQVSVAVLDAGGNLVTSAGDLVTLTLSSNPGSLTGGGPVAAVTGVAVFTNLSVSIPATGYTLAASAPGLTDGTSAPFDITP